jgi:hypothetical protein
MPRKTRPDGDPVASTPRVTTITIFLVAVLYGLAITAALSNTVVFLARLSFAEPALGNLALALLGWGIVLYVHHKRRWPPFGWPFSRR